MDIIRHLVANGYKALFVGGSVRDKVQGIPPLDYDILTNAPIHDLPTLFDTRRVSADAVGKSFPITIIDGVEVASSRLSDPDGSAREEKGSMPFPECDLARRDLTINSMAWDPLSDELIDPFEGQNDLEKGIIRFTGDPDRRIAEDPLRMVRACRFVAALEGTFDPASLSAIRSNTSVFRETIAFERIRMETLKAMACKTPSLFFKAIHKTGLLELIFPSLSHCIDLDGGPYHGESVFEHCMLTGDALSPRRPLLRLAGYLHDTGKFNAAIMKEGELTFPGHEIMGDQAIRDLEVLRFSQKEITYIDALIKTHMRPLKADSTPKAVRRLLAFLKAHHIPWQEFMRMRIADKSANLAKAPYTLADIKLRVTMIQNELQGRDENAFTLKDLALNGDDIMEILNISRGQTVGNILKELFDLVLDEPEANTYENLKRYLLKHY